MSINFEASSILTALDRHEFSHNPTLHLWSASSSKPRSRATKKRMSGFINKLKRKGKETVEDVTEVFTSPFEIKELEEINKGLLKDVDEEIGNHSTPLQKEEADAVEQALFTGILEKYDRKASRKLKREPTSDENDNINVYKRKLQRGLTARSGNIYSKFSSSVTALNDAAATSLRLAVESLVEFENSVKSRLPVLNEDLEAEIAATQASITDQVYYLSPSFINHILVSFSIVC
jgi:hypothetical protein